LKGEKNELFEKSFFIDFFTQAENEGSGCYLFDDGERRKRALRYLFQRDEYFEKHSN